MKISELSYLSKYKTLLFENNIFTTYQLINFLPITYQDYTLSTNISHSEINIFECEVIEIKTISKLNKNVFVIWIKSSVLNNNISLKIFTKLPQTIIKNKKYLMTFKMNVKDNIFVVSDIKDIKYSNKIIPTYNINNIRHSTLSKLIIEVIQDGLVSIYEKLDPDIINKYSLLDSKNMYLALHNPTNINILEKAKLTLKYQEAFQIILKKKIINSFIQKKKINFDLNLIKNILKNIPFELNDSQIKAISTLLDRVKEDYMTQSFLVGDVGSGKTIVALIISYILSFYMQVVIMAPTEILARQHYQTFSNIIKDRNISIVTGTTNNNFLDIENGLVDIIIGTHILASPNIKYYNLGYIIVDEQQKFGVNIRQILTLKSTNYDTLYLTATPIPRSLGLLLFDDHEIVRLQNRDTKIPILTKYINNENINLFFEHIKIEIENGHNAYVIVPAIQSDLIYYNINNVYDMLCEYFDKNIIRTIHGELPNNCILEELNKFTSQNGLILLSTRMVEIGIDCKNASIIGILDAKRFGLSELHQMRGRVGRSTIKSYCYLISDTDDNIRLSQLVNSNDGLELAENDLQNRGIGDIFGLKQSGLDTLKYLDIVKDISIINNIKEITNNYSETKTKKYQYLLKDIETKVN